MKFYDLFSGIGGFHLGLERTGHECVGACEIDKHARKVYSSHWADTHIDDDATKLERPPDNTDLICAGFPCQAFSVAGRRLGFEDARGTLFFEILRLAKNGRVPYLLLENVRGLLGHDEGRTFRTMLAALDECGYDAQWQCINSKYFVPQNRDRVFIFCNARTKPRLSILPVGGGNEESGGAYRDERTLIPINPGARDSYRVFDTDGISCTLKALGGGWGAKTGLYTVSRQQIRRLTPKECERLQGFPDGWTIPAGADTNRYRCLGNSVTVSVIEWLGKRLSV